jgi:twitching motility protein PilJ
MADKSTEGRYIPALAVLLLLTLGATAWLLYAQSGLQPTQPAGVESLVYTQTASMQARMALAGNAQAWDELAKTSAALRAIRATDLVKADKDSLAQARTNVAELVNSKGDVQAMQRVITRMDELIPGFSDGIYKLQGEQSVQRQPVVVAQLERVRLLGESVQLLAQRLPEGDVQLSRQLVDKEAQLQQIISGLQTGDTQLGIEALSAGATEQGISSIARRAAQISATVREGVSLSDMLVPAREAARSLDELAAQTKLGDAGLARSAQTLMMGMDVEWLRLFALLAVAAFLVLVILVAWLRTSGTRIETDRLVQQTEDDQQAILHLLDELDSLADGDLTVQATVNESITGAIADSVNYAVEALRDLVATINEGAILLEDATRQTEVSARTLASASEAQASQVKGASAAVGQMVASIDEVSGNAERSSDVARHSVDIAHKGGAAVRRTIEGMNTIRETIQDTSKRIKRLGESSQEIGDIVELINDIAEQTNILALNASIQASMAGEAGRGFAVVADEVQRLAERSTSATKQIEVLVSTIQSDTNEAVVSMERSTTDVVGGALLAENAGAALEEIEQVSNQIAMLVQNISGSAKDQAKDAKTVLQNVEQLQVISNETDQSAATTANYISKLSSLASQLRESASGFTLPQGDASAKADAEAMRGETGADSDEIAADNSSGSETELLTNEGAA